MHQEGGPSGPPFHFCRRYLGKYCLTEKLNHRVSLGTRTRLLDARNEYWSRILLPTRNCHLYQQDWPRTYSNRRNAARLRGISKGFQSKDCSASHGIEVRT